MESGQWKTTSWEKSASVTPRRRTSSASPALDQVRSPHRATVVRKIRQVLAYLRQNFSKRVPNDQFSAGRWWGWHRGQSTTRSSTRCTGAGTEEEKNQCGNCNHRYPYDTRSGPQESPDFSAPLWWSDCCRRGREACDEAGGWERVWLCAQQEGWGAEVDVNEGRTVGTWGEEGPWFVELGSQESGG